MYCCQHFNETYTLDMSKIKHMRIGLTFAFGAKSRKFTIFDQLSVIVRYEQHQYWVKMLWIGRNPRIFIRFYKELFEAH